MRRLYLLGKLIIWLYITIGRTSSTTNLTTSEKLARRIIIKKLNAGASLGSIHTKLLESAGL